MSSGSAFILNNYKTEKILQQSSYSCTELVMQDGIPYVRKTINTIGLPYAELKAIDHHNLPHVFYAVEAEGKTYVIEEYISGRTLQECLDAKIKFTAKQQKDIAMQLCDVLDILHSKGILHRDIKPSNIIVMHNLQQVKLIDFGIGRNFDSNDREELQDTRIMGTPGYAPPEQYGFKATDQRSDIYALGKTLLTLKNEYSSSEFIEVLKRAVEFDPEKRYQNATEFAQALKQGTKRSYLKPLIFCTAILLILITGYLAINKTQAPPVAKPSSKPATVHQPPSILQQPVYLTNLKQVGYEWWFDKTSLQTVDAKENIYKFRGINNKGPLITVENTSDYPAVNPRLKLELYSFGMKSNDFSYKTDSEHKENVAFSRLDRLGVARRVIITLEGTIPPHTKYTFSALQNVQDFYIYYKGDHGTVLGQLECKNMIPQNVGYAFNLK